MKKILFSVIAAIAFTQFAISQNVGGIKAGLNISTLHQTFEPKEIDTRSFKPLSGYQLGGYYKLKLKQKWNISGELNFSVIGAKVPYDSQEGFDSIGVGHYRNITIGYLEIPLMVQYNIHKFYIGFGPGIGFHLFSFVIVPL